MLVKKLQESWPNAKQAIEELEKEGKVMVIRTGGSSEREGHVKMVFWDELGQETAEKKYKVDEGESYTVCALSLTRGTRLTELSRYLYASQNFTQCGTASSSRITSL